MQAEGEASCSRFCLVRNRAMSRISVVLRKVDISVGLLSLYLHVLHILGVFGQNRVLGPSNNRRNLDGSPS